MYEHFFNLRERPFSLSPDPDYLYPSRVHRETLSYLRYGIDGHAGFIVITGEIGSGKTTLLQAVLRGLDRQTSVARIVNTMLDARELLEAVMLDFGLDPGHGRSKPHLLHDLARFLVAQRQAGRFALLAIDEAQNLSPAALEEVRMLSNLETEKSKLIQIALIGQPNLRDVLARPELEQLRQRVTVRHHLRSLDSEETHAYVNHRLRRAAIGAPLELSREVTGLIHAHAQGLPRKINVIADAILLFAYGEDRHAIDVDLTREVIEELEATGVVSAPSELPGLPGPPGPPALRVSAQEGDHSALAARESLIAERERQLSEQQRVLAEEYRLLHRGGVEGASVKAEAPRAAWPPPPRPAPSVAAPPAPRAARPAPAPSPSRAAADSPAWRILRTQPEPSDSIWTRLRRGRFALAKPVL